MQLFGSDDLAENAYDLALNIMPQNPSALLNRRALYLKQASGRPANDPKTAELSTKAQALLDRAQREATQFPRFFRTSFLLAANYGYLYSEQFALTLAEESRRSGLHDFESGAIEQARQINPESISARISSALLAMGKGDPAKAEAEYREVLQSQPNNLAARIGLAVMARDRKNLAEAIRIIEDNPSIAANVNVQSLLALLYLESRMTARGETLYNQALNATNHTAMSASFVALSAWQLSQFDRAESFAKKVLAVDVQNQPMLRLMAAVAQKRGDLSTALSYLQSVQSAVPQDISLQETVIRLALRLGQNVKAREDAKTLIDVDPNNMIGNLALATLNETPQIREKYLRRCLENRTHPLYGTAVNNLAYDLIRMRRYAEARTLAEEAVNLLPSDDKRHHTLAEAYKGLGQYDKAMEQIMLASTIAPDDANHTLVQGEILIAQGDAKKGYGLVVKILPSLSDEWRDRALKILKK
jgi:Tfp pilus assembly protein PilF